MSITKNVLLNWYSSMKKKLRKIPMIFDINKSKINLICDCDNVCDMWAPAKWAPAMWTPAMWAPAMWDPAMWDPTMWAPAVWDLLVYYSFKKVRPGHVSLGHASPSHVRPGHVNPGHFSPGHSSSGHVSPNHVGLACLLFFQKCEPQPLCELWLPCEPRPCGTCFYTSLSKSMNVDEEEELSNL